VWFSTWICDKRSNMPAPPTYTTGHPTAPELQMPDPPPTVSSREATGGLGTWNSHLSAGSPVNILWHCRNWQYCLQLLKNAQTSTVNPSSPTLFFKFSGGSALYPTVGMGYSPPLEPPYKLPTAKPLARTLVSSGHRESAITSRQFDSSMHS